MLQAGAAGPPPAAEPAGTSPLQPQPPQPSALPAGVAAAPAGQPPAAAPGPAAEGDPCACSASGISGGVDTTAPGCGQHLLASNSTDFVCFVNVSILPCPRGFCALTID